MTTDLNQKVNASHLRRDAYLYVRQSTPRQVLEHQESGKRHYALQQRAIALGWPVERIHIIDSDQGQSGSSATDREGFQKLVTAVSLGRAGIILGLEVSRPARNNTDWHRLLEICALADTLILDEDGIYDPAHFNDRLLLGLKGTMSEAELHILHARLRGGALNKARRGELVIPLPAGLLYDSQGQVILDPDQQVQESIRLLFATFRRVGSALGTARAYGEQGLLFPHRARGGAHDGELAWSELRRTRVVCVLRNPRYAGAFVYGRNRSRAKPDGTGRCAHRLPLEQWDTVLRDAHPGYITWQEYEENLRRLKENAYAHGSDRRSSPPREGPALLQGIVVCGMCGARMLVRYRDRGRGLESVYACFGESCENGRPRCQIISGKAIDEALSKLIVESVNPLALEVALSVQKEPQSRLEEADRLRRAQVERARFEADQAQRRYMRVDPANRLVADSLEADWNAKLRALQEAQTAYESQRRADRRVFGAEEEAKIYALASDFRRLWESPTTTDRERKRMIRLLIEDVTLGKGADIAVHVRFKGGATRSLAVPAPLCWREKNKTSPEILKEVDDLLNNHTYGEISTILNERGLRTRVGNSFGPVRIMRIEQKYALKSRYDRLREAGYLTAEELGQLLGLAPRTLAERRKLGLLKAARINDRPEYLYEPPAKRRAEVTFDGSPSPPVGVRTQ